MTHYSPLISALVTLLLTTILIYSKAGKTIQDIPNERSLHDAPIPRIGGVGLFAGVLSGWAIMVKSLSWWVVVPALLLFAVSLLDDIQGLPVHKRLAAHCVAAVILVAGSGLLIQNLALALAIGLFAVWMTNLYNFMDGSDGLAGGMTLLGFTMYGIASLMHSDETQAMMNFSIGTAALGFLYHNFHPAKVFMGDAGSIPLGFLVAAMGVFGWQQGHWPLWFPILVFSPFIVDASVTLAKRMLRGAKLAEAHREHYYQRSIQMGWGHRNVALFEYVLMFAAGVSAIWGMHQFPEFPWPLLLVWTAIYGVLMLMLDLRWKKFRQEQ